MSLENLEFDTKEIGRISIARTRVLSVSDTGATALAAAPASAPVAVRTDFNDFDIGNGNRLFFAPTGRGLRKGEGTLQDIDLYLLGLNYGITDNFSLGGYISLIPGVALNDQLLVLTPKLSFPINNKLHFGAGLLYLRIPTGNRNNGNTATGAGIGYGALTYGSADNNLTVGLGYGFVERKYWLYTLAANRWPNQGVASGIAH